MSQATKWRDGVKVVRADAIDSVLRDPASMGRATVFDFSGTGGQQTWLGSVILPPGANTGAHHHGRHEVAVYVVKGRSEIRWGDQLEFGADVSAGDFAYFAPNVPHQEMNPSGSETVNFLVVRSDNERIVVKLQVTPAEQP